MNNYKIFFSGIFILLYSCNPKAEKLEQENEETQDFISYTQEQFAKLPVSLGDIQEREMNTFVIVNGVVDVPPDQMYSVSYPIAGFVTQITHNLLPGRWVKKGEILAEIQSLELLQLQEDYLNETTKREFLMQENERQKALLQEEATAKRKLQETENALKLNGIRIKSLSEKLLVLGINPAQLSSASISATHKIRAKNNAYIKTVNLSIGKNFSPNDLLFELINTEHLHAELKVFGQDKDLINIGQKVVFDYKGGEALGKIYLIDKNVDMTQKSLNVHVHIENEVFEKSLYPGQYISGKIFAAQKKVKALPESAILRNSEGVFCYIVTKQKDKVRVEQVSLKLGNTSEGFVEILNSEEITGQIVSKGVSFIGNVGEEE
jgi:membrane fusion protein, heavy metal efflux system